MHVDHNGASSSTVGKWTRLDREPARPPSQAIERKHVSVSLPSLWKRGATQWTEFDIDGATGGNQVADILNDYRIDVQKAIARPSTRGKGGGGGGGGGGAGERRPNCQFETCLVHGVPTLVIVTLVAVGAGQELLLDYGLNYWRVVLSNESVAAAAAK